MKAYDEIWGVAEDNFGVITSAKAEELGVSRQNLVAMERTGVLTRLCHGVYQVKHHVPGKNDFYGVGVAMVGDGAYLRGASVVGMLNLAPTNPGLIYVGSNSRVRRRLPDGFRVKDRTICQTTVYEGYEGIPCQPLFEALLAAKAEGAIEGDRIAEAALNANEKGLITDEECTKFQV
jgi:predicted transcriptional regulator of viral defense system